MKKTPPSTIPLEYDYQLRMSPTSSAAANFYDNQTSSLFGDPVPPPQEDFLENLDNHLYGSLRRSSIVRDFPKPNSFAPNSDEVAGFHLHGAPGSERVPSPRVESGRIFPVEPQSHVYLRPEIRILPGSDSSSESRLSPASKFRSKRGSVDVDSDNIYYQHYQEQHWDSSRRLSTQTHLSNDGEEAEDIFRDESETNDHPRRIFPNEPVKYSRQISNDSFSSSEWFKPSNNYQDWTRIPRLRPSSKNVMSIKHNQPTYQGSAVATLIHDSNGSSSSEEKVSPDISKIHDYPVKLRPKTSHYKTETEVPQTLDAKHSAGLPPPPPKRDVSPVIVTNAITTGADYRISPPRPHKKTSFTIIAEKSPQSSRAPSPHQHASGTISPFLGRGFKDSARPPRPLSQPVPSTTRLRLPVIASASNVITSDDSPRPSVQFNMSSFPGQMSPSKLHSKGILQNKPEYQPRVEKPLTHNQKVRSYDALPRISGAAGEKSLRPPNRRLNKSSLDLYATKKIEPRKGYVNPNPTSRQKGLLHVIGSAEDSPSRIPVPKKLAASMDDLTMKRRNSLSPLRIEKRLSNASTERRSSSLTEPRSSVVSLTSDRRSSNISSVTTSDFSFRRPSNSSLQLPSNRRQSMYKITVNKAATPKYDTMKKKPSPISKTARKVAKPTTLSPIIGTPNRDGPSSSEDVESIFRNGRRESGTKIPVRDGSSFGNSRRGSVVNSRAPSVVTSRSSSPTKDYLNILQQNSRLESRPPSRATSRPTSRPPSRSTSRPTSRQNSRSVSRSSSRQGSTHKSQPNSRSNSRSNSRLSQRGASPTKGIPDPPNRRRSSPGKSRSSSPKKTRRKSLSPEKSPKKTGIGSDRSRKSNEKPKAPSRKVSPAKESKLRRESSKRSSVRKEPASAKKMPSSNKKPESSVKRTPSTVRKESNLKKENSNLKRSTSNFKKETIKRETSSLTKTPSSNNLKREPSSLKKVSSSTSLKRQPSNLSKTAAGVKREGSVAKNISGSKDVEKKKDTTTNGKKSSSVKAAPVSKKDPPSLMKKRTDSNLSKKLDKKNSFRSEKSKQEIPVDQDTAAVKDAAENDAAEDNGKLVPLTKQNVVSMTTAAIATQPVQITTAVTNQIPLSKGNSSNQLIGTSEAAENIAANMADLSEDVKEMLPAAILEKSTKTLETIQKTVTEATEEIQKTITENLTNLKTLESDMGKIIEDVGKPTPLEKTESVRNISENATSNENKASDDAGNNASSAQAPKSPVPPSQPIEAEVSVVNSKASSEKLLTPKVNHNNNNNHSNNNKEVTAAISGKSSELGKDHNEELAERVSERAISVLPEVECESANLQNYEEEAISGETIDLASKDHDGKTTDSGEEGKGHTNEGMLEDDDHIKNSGSQEHLDEEKDTGCCGRSRCCKCCQKFCMPCRRCQCSKCCRKKTEMETAVFASEVNEKESCWKRMKCCKKKEMPQSSMEEKMHKTTMETIAEEPETARPEAPKQNKCRLCLNKFFCCKATNKVEAFVTEAEEVKKCCFCIPIRKKKEEVPAWQERRESILSEPPPPGAKSSRLLEKLMCWKKPKPDPESRRQSLQSKKQSIAPTLPPEDTRKKLHNDLVEYNSKMKGAIPVMPLCLAWFCMILNCLIPGLGTILSGFFGLCVGIPRFSQFDSAKARIGSLIINCIVGVSQLFCVLFCFVGWGWSIWWGTIMLKTARKLKKIKKVERLEMEEEQRQAEAAKTTDRDVEAAKS